MRSALFFFCLVLTSGSLPAEEEQPLARSFELRVISRDPKADGVTDFKGPTEVLDTEGRIRFLRAWADYGSRFFGDPGLDTRVVKPGEAAALLARIKPQPLPEVRKVIPLERWQWISAHPGPRWKRLPGIPVEGACLHLDPHGGEVLSGKRFPAVREPWRMQASLRVRLHARSTGTLIVRLLGPVDEGDRVPVCSVGLDPARRPDLADGRWHAVLVDLDFETGRFNTRVDGAWLDYDRPMEEGHSAGCEYIELAATLPCEVDDLRVAEILRRPGDPGAPLDTRIVLHGNFQADFDPRTWAQPGLDTSAWDTAKLPFAIGGREYAGEDLLLRREVTLDTAPRRAFLRLETLTPGGEVWVNGRPAAVIHDRTPRIVDITGRLKTGVNLITLRVWSYTNPDPSPHAPRDLCIGWFAGRVRLELTGETRIEQVFSRTTALEGGTAHTRHALRLFHQGREHFHGKVRVSIAPWFPEEGAPVATAARDLHLRPNRGDTLEIDLPVPHARLWTPEHPRLYTVHAVLLDAGDTPVDDQVVTFGLRTVDQGGGFFRLNGRPFALFGVQIMGYRVPLLDMTRHVRCAPAEALATELLQTLRCGGNFLRVHVHATRSTADGINDPRLAEMADQVGVMLAWQTPAWLREGHASGMDLARWPAYAKEVINHPSIVVWELTNHPNRFKAEGVPPSESADFVNEVMSLVPALDDSRLVTPTTHWPHTRFGPQGPPELFYHPLCTHGMQDATTGYGATWERLRTWPHAFARQWLENPDFAYFNWEHQETIGQPNWTLARNTPWYGIFSYEHGYDRGSIGRELSFEEWRESQAWQAFAAWESIKKMRQYGVSGFSWCCLHGGPNTGTYQKPLLGNLGHAKLAFWANQMAFQPTVAGSWDVDTVLGPQDALVPAVIHLGDAATVELCVTVKDLSGTILREKHYPGIELPAGRKVVKLAPLALADLPPGIAAVEYVLR